MEKYETVIVGAGPAGTSCAQSICENSDKSVLILEALSSPSSQCGGATIGPRIKRILPNLPSSIIEKKVNKIVVSSKNERAEMEVDFDKSVEEPLVYILNRESFDQWMLKKAKEAGAEIKTNHKVTDVERKGDMYKIITNKGTFRSEYLVGADGANSRVGEMIGMDTRVPEDEMNTCLQYHVEELDDYSNKILLVLNEYYSGDYAWIFPEESGTKVGVGVPTSLGNPKEYLDKFLEDYLEYDVEVRHKGGGLVPTTKPLDSGYKEKGALVGDALRVTDPVIGAGIYNAILTGKELGNTIANNEPLSAYDKRWKDKLLNQLKISYSFKKMISSWSDEDFDKFVRAMDGYVFSDIHLDEQVKKLAEYMLIKNPVLGFELGFGILINKLI